MTDSTIYLATLLAVGLAMSMTALNVAASLTAWGTKPHSRVVRFTERHIFGLSVAEAAVWTLLFALSLARDGDGANEWAWRALNLAIIASAIVRAVRHRRKASIGTAFS